MLIKGQCGLTVIQVRYTIRDMWNLDPTLLHL